MAAAKAWLRASGPPWRVLARRPIYQNAWIAVDEFDTVAPTGKPALYGRVAFKNLAIGVLPVHDDGTVVLVGQHRFTFDAWSWEMPEGGVPLADDPLEGARRELREETGLTASDWRQVLTMHLSNSVSDERAVCYLATGLTAGEAAPDDTEALQIARVPFREALEAALGDGIEDSLTVATLLRAHHMAVEGELPAALARAMLG